MTTIIQDCKDMGLSYEESVQVLEGLKEIENGTGTWVDEDTFWKETFKGINAKMKKNVGNNI